MHHATNRSVYTVILCVAAAYDPILCSIVVTGVPLRFMHTILHIVAKLCYGRSVILVELRTAAGACSLSCTHDLA